MGTFKIDRDLFCHPLFKNEPYTEREAWIWMVSTAAFKGHSVRANSTMIHIERGQFIGSVRRISERFQWSINRLRRFLKLLENEHMIVVGTDTPYSVITVCNYGKYQGLLTNSDTPANTGSDTASDTLANTNRSKGEEERDKKEGKRSPPYKFKGQVIRLTEKDYDKWKERFYAIPDFDEALRKLDAWHAKNETSSKDWFRRVEMSLSKDQQEWMSKKRPPGEKWYEHPANKMPSPAGG